MSDSARPLRVGIVGAGALASTRVYPALRYSEVELVAVCDLDTARAALIGGRFGSPVVYSDFRTMLDEARLDAVIGCVGPEVHFDLALEAMRRGIPVYTEKPPAPTSQQAEEMAAVSAQTGVLCMTGFKKRFANAYVKARAGIDSAEFGDTTLVTVQQAAGARHYIPNTTNTRLDFLLDFGIHALDLARYLGGDVSEVIALETGDVAYAISLRYTSGAVGTISLSANQSWDLGAEEVHVYGGPGNYLNVHNSVSMKRYRDTTLVDWNDPNFSTAGGDSMLETGFAGELIAFFAAISTGAAVASTIASAAATMRLYEAVVESARSGRAVSLEGASA